MPLVAEDTIRAINSITEINLEETIQKLETLCQEHQIKRIQQGFLEELKQIHDLRNAEFDKILKTVIALRILQTEIQNDELKIQDKIDNNQEKIKLLERLLKTLQTAEAGAVVILLIVALKSEAEDKIDWLKNLNTSLVEFLHVLEKNIEIASLIELLETNLQEVFGFLLSEKMKDWKQKAERTELSQNYANSIRTTTKAILWEIHQKKNKKTLENKDKHWDLVIGKQPYKELLQESQRRIHLLDTLEPQTDEELQIQLEALDVIEREFGERR